MQLAAPWSAAKEAGGCVVLADGEQRGWTLLSTTDASGAVLLPAPPHAEHGDPRRPCCPTAGTGCGRQPTTSEQALYKELPYLRLQFASRTQATRVRGRPRAVKTRLCRDSLDVCYEKALGLPSMTPQ